MSLSDIPNLSFFSFPLYLGLAALPHWWSIVTVEKLHLHGGWNNCNPRAWVARLNAKAASGKKLSDLEERLLRAQSCQQNGFEWFGTWAAAVIVGNMIGLPAKDLNLTSAVFLLSRVVYTLLYVNTSTRRNSYLRTAVFNFGVLLMLRYYYLAGVYYMRKSQLK